MPKNLLYLVFAILASVVAILLIIVYRYATVPLSEKRVDMYASALERNDDVANLKMVSDRPLQEGWSARIVNREGRQPFSYPEREFQIKLN